MKKFFLVLVFLFITLYSSLIYIDRYFAYLAKKRITFNLTSLMIPFEQINRNSTFSCSEVTLRNRYQLEFEQLEYYRLNQFYEQPSINRHSNQYNIPLPQLPYFYSLWKTSSLLPRLITPCEHHVYIKLIKIFDEISQQNAIEYMIIYGTLLGSYRNHGKNFQILFQIVSHSEISLKIFVARIIV